MIDLEYDKICYTLLKYRIIRLEDNPHVDENIWHEKFSDKLTFIYLGDSTDLVFELVIINQQTIEELDDHVINKISHQYRLSDKLRNILINDNLIDNLEDRLKEIHMYIQLKYL